MFLYIVVGTHNKLRTFYLFRNTIVDDDDPKNDFIFLHRNNTINNNFEYDFIKRILANKS